MMDDLTLDEIATLRLALKDRDGLLALELAAEHNRFIVEIVTRQRAEVHELNARLGGVEHQRRLNLDRIDQIMAKGRAPT